MALVGGFDTILLRDRHKYDAARQVIETSVVR